MTSLTNAQIKVLQAAPIGIDDASNGDPRRGCRHRYQGADGRLARALWLRGLLEHDARVGSLNLTLKGRLTLERALAASSPSSIAVRSRP